MPGQPISNDVKRITMLLIDAKVATMDDILLTGVYSKRTYQRIRSEWLAHGHALANHPPTSRRGRPRAFTPGALRYVQSLLARTTCLRLEELQRRLRIADHGDYTVSTISRTLKRLGLSKKKLWKYATQQDQGQRDAFARQIGQYEPEQLVFVDEATVDLDATQRVYGRSLKGRRAFRGYHFRKGTRFIVSPACSLGSSPYAVSIKTKSFKGDNFYRYLRDKLLPVMNEYPAPRSVIVCDNASVHKLSCVPRLVELAGECAACRGE